MDYNKINTLDELIKIIGTTKHGGQIKDVGEPEEFKRRLESFKYYIKTELPELTVDEILFLYKHRNKLNKINDWFGFDYLMTALDYVNAVNKY